MKLLSNLILVAIVSLFVLPVSAQGWVSIPTSISNNLILWDMDFPASQSSIGYAVGSNYTYNGKARVLKTTDGGLSWDTILVSDVSNTGMMCVGFTSTTNGFAGTMGGDILHTTDGGTTWVTEDVDPSLQEGEVDNLEFFDAQTGVLNTTNRGIYYTTDGGSNWTVASNRLVGIHDITYASEYVLFAVGEGQLIYKSTDGGDNWSQVFKGSKSGNHNLGVDFLNDTHGYVTSEDGEVFKTIDGGVTWTTQTFMQGGLINDVYMLTEDVVSLACTPGIVYTTTDGGINWELDSSSMNLSLSYYRINRLADGTEIVCGAGPDGGIIMRKQGPPVGVKEVSILALTLAPNPVTDVLNVTIASGHSFNQLSVFDSQGREIGVYTLSGLSQIEINTQAYPSGIYFISVQSGTEKHQLRFIKH